jgi:hypothetical protein
MSLDTGSYSLTGQDTTLLWAHTLTLETGEYTLTGQDVSLDYSGAVFVDFVVVADASFNVPDATSATFTVHSATDLTFEPSQ